MDNLLQVIQTKCWIDNLGCFWVFTIVATSLTISGPERFVILQGCNFDSPDGSKKITVAIKDLLVPFVNRRFTPCVLFDFNQNQNYLTLDLCFQPCTVTSMDHWVAKLTKHGFYSQLLLKQLSMRPLSNSFSNRFQEQLLKRAYIILLLFFY